MQIQLLPRKLITNLAIVFASGLFLTAITFSVYPKHRGSRIIESYDDLPVLTSALSAYAYAHDGFCPPLRDTGDVRQYLTPYAMVTESASRRFPAGRYYSAVTDTETNETFQPNSYLSKKKLEDFKPTEQWMVAFYVLRPDRFGNHLVVTLDGEIHHVKRDQWDHLRKACGIPNVPIPPAATKPYAAPTMFL